MSFLPANIFAYSIENVLFVVVVAQFFLLLAVNWWRSAQLSNIKLKGNAEALRVEDLRIQDLAKMDNVQLSLHKLDSEFTQQITLNQELNSSLHDLQMEYVKQEEQLKFSHQLAASMPEKEAKLASLQAELSSLQTKLMGQKEHHQSQMVFIDQSRKQMAAQFESLSLKIYEQQAKRFNEESQLSLGQLINPLKTQISEFKQKVESSHEKESAERNMLAGKISELQKQTQQIGDDAVNLAKALKGESKTQGNWGEVVLERLLEESGLEKGREYETQVSLQSEMGEKRYPDVIIKLPQGKDIVIDSKVSLLDYEHYCNAEAEGLRSDALKRHVQSLRNHINGLSLKEYEKLEGIRSLDFVFLFVPIEAAFMAALQADNSLFQEAYNKHIVLVSPTTLLASLRTVENLWRHEKQHKNAQKIADQAGALHDQFILMLQSLDDVGSQLDKAQAAYELSRKRLATGRGNLLKRSQEIKKLGAKTKKTLPDSFLDELDRGEAISDVNNDNTKLISGVSSLENDIDSDDL